MRAPGLLLAFTLLGAPRAAPAATIALVVGENEYHTWETLPVFVRDHLEPAGHTALWIQASPREGDSAFTNAAALARADLLVISARRRPLPEPMMRDLRAHLAAGKPVLGIRTASHAFALRKGEPPAGHAVWPEFDREVLGADYEGHSPAGPEAAVTARGPHPILLGLPESFPSPSSLYQYRNPQPGVTVLISGAIPGQPAQPVAWTFTSGSSRVFYTSLGSPGDFARPEFNRLLANACAWLLEPARP